ncbi:MAG: hypothetical protein JO134_08650 [Xanthobacteraceae bacterium]|nr:hypothetical protein [Xanthobacteraceae bacterium]
MRVMIIAFAVGICVLPAAAQSPDADDKRFTLYKVDDGYLRLDGRTGTVSLCTRPDSGWVCRTVPDERSALESEIGRLAAENAELKRTLLDRDASLPGLPPRPPADVGVGSAAPAGSDAERVVALAEKLWRRTLDVIGNLKRDLADRL